MASARGALSCDAERVSWSDPRLISVI